MMKDRITYHSEALLGLGLFIIGVLLFFRADQIPGDLGDARFNMYVLEHGYRWLIGLDKSFWSAPFFYPAQNVIAYSDNLLGSFLIFAVFRLLGASRETAFQLWVLVLSTLNYLVTWIVLRRQTFHPLAAIAAAYLFAFPLIMAAQIGHAQLVPRFMVPVAFFMASRFIETGSVKHFSYLLAACAYQIYLGIYIGYFLLLSIATFCLLLFTLRRKWNDLSIYFMTEGLHVAYFRSCAYAACCIVFFLALLPLAVPYYHAHEEVEHSAWWLVSSLLPHWQSYLNAPTSYLWGGLLRYGVNLSLYPVEHRLFFGALPCASIIALLYISCKKTSCSPSIEVALAMLGTVVLLAISTFYFAGFTLYTYIYNLLPGAAAIRGVTRIMLILLYPIAFVFCWVVHYLIVKLSQGITTYGSTPYALTGIVLFALTVLDQASHVDGVSKRECKRRVARMQAAISRARARNMNYRALWVSVNNDSDGAGIKNLDVMLAGQNLGLNVVNGYSGYLPRGFPPAMFLPGGDSCSSLGIWAQTHPGTITNDSLLQIGSSCVMPDGCFPIPLRGFGPIEVRKMINFWAVDAHAVLQIPNSPNNCAEEILSFDLTTLDPRSVCITGWSNYKSIIRLQPGQRQHIEIRILPSDSVKFLTFETDSDGSQPKWANRKLFFDVENVQERVPTPDY
jgi:hypothetical protein